MQVVYVIAFRHKTPGEGVGGFEWDPIASVCRARIDAIGVYDDEQYETWQARYEFEDDAKRESITDALDAMVWEDWSRA